LLGLIELRNKRAATVAPRLSNEPVGVAPAVAQSSATGEQMAPSDPIAGRRDAANDHIFRSEPVRRHLKSLPDFTMIPDGARFPGGYRGIALTHQDTLT
jgi:hypothetical protein